MPKITALIHTHDAADAPRLDRTLESLRPCDEVLIINHGNLKEIEQVATRHGATIKGGVPGVSPGAYLIDARNDWILCLRPTEALSEAMEATLFQWKDEDHDEDSAFCFAIREEGDNGWQTLACEPRLVNRNRVNWTGDVPANVPHAGQLQGDLLRFGNP